MGNMKALLFEQYHSFKQNLENLTFGEPIPKHIEEMGKEYESMQDFKIDSWLNMPQPPNGSSDTLVELKHISNIYKDDSFIKTTDDMHLHFENGLKPFNIKYDKEKYKKITKEVLPLIYKLKYHYNRPRPDQLAKELGVTLDGTFLKSAQTPSYPSGHSTQGALIGLLLADENPEKKEELMKLGLEIGHGRLMAKVHYPSDHNFGVELAKCLFEYIKGN